MLRHYDERGLLTPAIVDPVTGYRRYRLAQLDLAQRIRRLRDVGFTVSGIAAVLSARDRDAYRQALELQRDILTQQAVEAQGRVYLIEQLITTEGTLMDAITVSRVAQPARTLVALRGTVARYEDEGELWARFMPELQRQGVIPIGPGGVIEHDGEFREADVDESVFVPVAPGAGVAAPLEIVEIAAHEAVVARLVGPYSLISEAHARIAEFAREHGLALAPGGRSGPVSERNRNIYLTAPDQPGDPITEVIMPLASAANEDLTVPGAV